MHTCTRCSEFALPERCPCYEPELIDTHTATVNESDVLTPEQDAELWRLFWKLRREYRHEHRDLSAAAPVLSEM